MINQLHLKLFMQFIFADVLSLNGSEGASRLSIASLRDANHGDGDVNIPYTSYTRQLQRPGDSSAGNSARNSVCETSRSSVHPLDADSRLRSDGNSNEAKPVFLDEILSLDETAGRVDGLFLPNNCLPCLASTVPSVEKRRSLSSSPPSSRKKAALKLSFKWKEGHPNATLREYYYH